MRGFAPVSFACAGILAFGLLSPATAFSQTTTTPAQHDHSQAQPPAAQTAQPATDEVDRLVAKMNAAATGDEKITAMTDLLALLVKERGAARGQGQSAPPAQRPMMGGMMSGQMGSCMADGKCACPMMQHDKP